MIIENNNNEDISDQKITKQKKGRIFVKNLIFDINEKLLTKLFNKFGKIDNINIPLNKSNNKPKGFAFIEFENKNSALKAVKELDNSKYKGRTINVSLSLDQRLYKNEANNEVNNISSDNNVNIKNESNSENTNEDENISDINDDNSIKNVKETKDSIFKDEDLSSTIFVKNISLETTKKQFYDFFSKFGDLIYAKLVEDNESKVNKGVGFVKFKTQQLATQLADKSKQIDNDPLLIKDLDPLNEMVLNDNRLKIFKAVDKSFLEKIELKKSETAKKSKRKSFKILIAEDKNNKRNLRNCVYGTINSLKIENIKEKELNIRKNYVKEKLKKMENPNLHCSNDTIIFKYINRNYTEKDIRDNILIIISKYHDNSSKLKTLKIFKRVKLFKNKDNFSGTVIVQFSSTYLSQIFIENITKDDNYKLFKDKGFGVTPIIEYTFEDIRIKHKVEEKIKNTKISNAIKNDTLESPNSLIKIKDHNKDNNNIKNDKKLKAEIINLYNNNKQNLNNKILCELKDKLNMLISRGIKQRLKLKIFGKQTTINNNDKSNLNNNERNKKETLRVKIIKKDNFKNISDKLIKKEVIKKKKDKLDKIDRNCDYDKYEKAHLGIN